MKMLMNFCVFLILAFVGIAPPVSGKGQSTTHLRPISDFVDLQGAYSIDTNVNLALDPVHNIRVSADADLTSSFNQTTASVKSSSGDSSGEISVIHSFGYSPEWSATELAWDGASLWIAENFYGRIWEFDPVSGNALSDFEAPGVNLGGLAWDGTYLYTARYRHDLDPPPGDTLPDELFTLTTSGEQMNSWEVPDSPDATPYGTAYDKDSGNLWVSDAYYAMIYELDRSTGDIVSSFPYPYSGVQGLTWQGGHIYAVDRFDLMLYKFDTAGNTVDAVSIASLGIIPEGLTWDGQYFWITEDWTKIIYQIDAGFVMDTMADVEVNGQDGPLAIDEGDPLLVTLNVDPGYLDGTAVDWWVATRVPSGAFYWYTLAGWERSPTPIRAYGGPLMTLTDFPVLDMSALPAGVYRFYFAFDDNVDGVLDATFLDSALVTIQ
ncbi:MAG: hypothetical protein U9Q81_09735 [Pseudomonadota bacterium]|nr:hypothetical protein [Pseudomonadota bacterium]